MTKPIFDLDRFLEDCRTAVSDPRPQPAVREILARAVADPSPLIRSLGEPRRGGIEKLYQAQDLTVLNVIWAPYMTLMPHNHKMWAIIGVYGGREDNIFWRRIAGESGGVIEAAGAKSLSERDAVPLGQEIIHSVTNPTPRYTGAIHIYGGDFFAVPRSEWDPETLVEQPYNMDKNLRLFEEANARSQGMES